MKFRPVFMAHLIYSIVKQMSTSVVTTLITATATLIVPTQRVPTLVLVNQVGLEMGHRAQVHVCLLW